MAKNFTVSGDPSGQDLSNEQLLTLYVAMLRIRVFEERVAELLEAQEINTPTHLYIGQEAIAVGVCQALRRDDIVFGNHRSHGHYLAKGGDMNALMAELLGKETGCSRGRGGSMHVIAPEVGMMGTVPIVSGTIPLAVGTALAAMLQKRNSVSVAFFGDGALEEGTAHESFNLAAHRRLPVLFVCENNLYASHLSLLERRAEDNIGDLARAHGMVGCQVDGNDIAAVYGAAHAAVDRARGGGGPSLVECRTYRWRGHVGPRWDLDVGVNRKNELANWQSKDPIAQLRDRLARRGITPQHWVQLERDVRQEVEAALVFARESRYPDATELYNHVYRDERWTDRW